MDLWELDKEIIKQCEIIRIKGEKASGKKLFKEIPIPNIDDVLGDMINRDLLSEDLIPTEKGRELINVGLTGGTFDIIHIGHVRTLEEAKKYVDILAVVIARDATVRMLKQRDPLNAEDIRLEIVSNLKPVDVAILGSEEDFMIPVRRINPDIIFLGYDQEMPPPLKGRIKNIEVKKLNVFYRGYKTSLMIKRLLNMLGY